MKLLLQVLGAVVLLLTGAALLITVMHGSGLSFEVRDDISRADYLSIILSALAVMLTAITIFLGALAIMGWATFEARVKQSSESFLERRFSEDDPRYTQLVEELKEQVTRQSLKGGRPTYPDENDSPFNEDAA